jgi:hypothetical protein
MLLEPEIIWNVLLEGTNQGQETGGTSK